jgi:plasmid stabilization system protein ParE
MAGNDLPPPATFLLTRNAALDLRRIHTLSRREWGEDVADQYLSDLYAAMGAATTNPEKGRLRQYRSAPFLMVSARHRNPDCGTDSCFRHRSGAFEANRLRPLLLEHPRRRRDYQSRQPARGTYPAYAIP